MISAENLEPKSSDTEVVSENNVGGRGFSDKQVWQESITSEIILEDPGQRKYLESSFVI